MTTNSDTPSAGLSGAERSGDERSGDELPKAELSKAELRRWARRLAPPTDAETAYVVDGLVAMLAPLERSSVLVYVSMPGELPADAVVATLEQHDFYTTRTPASGWLTVHPFDAPRETHRFGYEHPTADAPRCDPGAMDIVIAPGLCFDERGGRLGWGRGYYDHLLAEARPDVLKIGMTLERRIVDQIITEPHDVLMTHLATERGVRPVTANVGGAG